MIRINLFTATIYAALSDDIHTRSRQCDDAPSAET